ncbi:hypothetical protein [Sphaerotilus hippei]|uniref:hypothetical protein n=1 Tax=Sphaerotilus hippei TaxID=744406 RepID=UPI0011B4FA1C|nr:hypothetical protein [Sphaerotilus hippei]
MLDRGDLADPVPALLAPDCHLLVPLGVQVDGIGLALQRATEQQIQVLRLLRSQPRLLVEGGAGSCGAVPAGAGEQRRRRRVRRVT